MIKDTIGNRYTIAESEIVGNNLVGKFSVYSTPVGLFMFAQIEENEEFGGEREILRLKIKPKIKNSTLYFILVSFSHFTPYFDDRRSTIAFLTIF